MQGSGKLGSIVTQCLYTLNDSAENAHPARRLGFAALAAENGKLHKSCISSTAQSEIEVVSIWLMVALLCLNGRCRIRPQFRGRADANARMCIVHHIF
jgi:hypothetical protein